MRDHVTQFSGKITVRDRQQGGRKCDLVFRQAWKRIGEAEQRQAHQPRWSIAIWEDKSGCASKPSGRGALLQISKRAP